VRLERDLLPAPPSLCGGFLSYAFAGAPPPQELLLLDFGRVENLCFSEPGFFVFFLWALCFQQQGVRAGHPLCHLPWDVRFDLTSLLSFFNSLSTRRIVSRISFLRSVLRDRMIMQNPPAWSPHCAPQLFLRPSLSLPLENIFSLPILLSEKVLMPSVPFLCVFFLLLNAATQDSAPQKAPEHEAMTLF